MIKTSNFLRFKNQVYSYLKLSVRLTGWLLLRALSQALMTLAIARSLGPTDYGNFIAIVATASFFTPLAGFGLHGIILIRGTRNSNELPQLIGTTLKLWTKTASIFSFIGVIATLLVFPLDQRRVYIIYLVLSEIISPSLVELVARIEQSQQKTAKFGAILSGLALFRLFAAIVFLTAPNFELTIWITYYSTASLIYCGLLILWLLKTKCVEKGNFAELALLWEGLPFSIGALSMRLQAEFNKPVLAQASYSDTGNLNVAQRTIDIVTIPLIALQEVIWPRLYSSNDPTKRMLPTLIGIILTAFGLGCLLSFFSPLLPKILGNGYATSSTLLMWLAWLPCIQTVRNFVNALVIASGDQKRLTLVYIASAITGIALSLWLIPLFSARGAIAAAYLSEFLTVSMLLTLIKRNER